VQASSKRSTEANEEAHEKVVLTTTRPYLIRLTNSGQDAKTWWVIRTFGESVAKILVIKIVMGPHTFSGASAGPCFETKTFGQNIVTKTDDEPTWLTDRASHAIPEPSLTCQVTWCDIAHRAERGIGHHRALACAGRPWHCPETAAMPRRSGRVRSRTRQESTGSQPHSIHTPWCGLTNSCGFVGILPFFYSPPRCQAALKARAMAGRWSSMPSPKHLPCQAEPFPAHSPYVVHTEGVI
jgi:hypothetical protein